MKTTLLVTLAATTLVTFCGCTTAPVLRPPSAKLRDNLGRVAVVAQSNATRIRYQVPDSKADVAAERQRFELVTPRMVVEQTGPAHSQVDALVIGSMAIATPLVVMGGGGAPLAQEIRRAYGLLVADAAPAVATARAVMAAATAPLRFDEQLHARSGRVLYYDYLDYRSDKHTLVTWTKDDARLFHVEIERSIARLSGEIVAQVLTRPSTEIARRAELAAQGIERRPPAATSPTWSVPRTTRALVRR